MRFTNSSFNGWSWKQSTDVSSNGKRNTTAVTPEMPCVPRSPLQQHLTRPNGANRCAALERRRARDEGKQDKGAASCAAPPTTSARSAGSLRGTGMASQAEKKKEIEVAQGPIPPAARLWGGVFGQKRRVYEQERGKSVSAAAG